MMECLLGGGDKTEALIQPHIWLHGYMANTIACSYGYGVASGSPPIAVLIAVIAEVCSSWLVGVPAGWMVALAAIAAVCGALCSPTERYSNIQGDVVSMSIHNPERSSHRRHIHLDCAVILVLFVLHISLSRVALFRTQSGAPVGLLACVAAHATYMLMLYFVTAPECPSAVKFVSFLPLFIGVTSVLMWKPGDKNETRLSNILIHAVTSITSAFILGGVVYGNVLL